MSSSLGHRLNIRSSVYVAGEPIPLFWPMRSFIYRNPLHGLEHLPFHDAVQRGSELFRARGYLPRSLYQEYLAQGKLSRTQLQQSLAEFAAGQRIPPGIDLLAWLMALLTDYREPLFAGERLKLVSGADLKAALLGRTSAADGGVDEAQLQASLRAALPPQRPLYEVIDTLYGTQIGAELDKLVIKSCLDFFDEGQSVWGMPSREQGLFAAWRELAQRNFWPSKRSRQIKRILSADPTPEGVIEQVMRELQIPETEWGDYFTRELARLHGWAGFIRWRESAKHYYWGQRYPAGLVELLAVRLTLAAALIAEQSPKGRVRDAAAIRRAIDEQPRELYLRHEFYSGAVLPALAQQVEMALASDDPAEIDALCGEYLRRKRGVQARSLSQRLRELARITDSRAALEALSVEQLDTLMSALAAFEAEEGRHWLQAQEAQAMQGLLPNLQMPPPQQRQKRPFVQALFCIDTRSERIRRHLEAVGDYQTFGIAGFFGVPVSFLELGKGSETHLCPVLLTPKNLVLEMAPQSLEPSLGLGVLEKAAHELKESVLTPFVTVEAIGLLFGFDMVGKTVAPQAYHHWRKHLHSHKPATHLLLDKLDREQADSILRTVQRAVIIRAVEQELGLQPEHISDGMIRSLRECALEHELECSRVRAELGFDAAKLEAFIQRLRSVYKITPAAARLQLERLGRIGFSLDEQANFVGQALKSIGLTRQFSRFVLLVGHGSRSENNPYESSLECGACGGNHGLVNARVLAQMANKPQVRQRLRAQGIEIADDAWFIPALHDTTTDELALHDLDLLPSSHLVYLDRLRSGLIAASRLSASERLPTLQPVGDMATALKSAQRNAVDWSQVRPEWGLSRNAFFLIGRRDMTQQLSLDGRAFLHSYDYRLDPKRRLLENILTGPLVVGQWINMEYYFSTVDNQRYGSGSKVYHNVAGRFGVMSGNLSDLRTGLPAQTVLDQGKPYHEPMRLIALIEAPLAHAQQAIEAVVAVKRLVRNGWIRMLVADPLDHRIYLYENQAWRTLSPLGATASPVTEEAMAS